MWRPDPKPEKKKHKNISRCSNGTTVTEDQIKVLLSKSYREQGNVTERCAGCGKQAINHAHIIPKARCKVLGKTELIWNSKIYFPACEKCHVVSETVSNGEWAKLNNADHILSVVCEHDHERYVIMIESLK